MKGKVMSERNKLGWGWLIILALGAILAGSLWFAYSAWTGIHDVTISTAGMIAMGLGVFFSLLVGIGLMALIFWSNHKGYDR